ncbi:hypothetical protein L4D76_28000 [Photobacterium sagamiensis]|uniref:hypothetical protein n=1 Tax=Photobacterium sagamiensis TaxID=2910241 RepID=UPI003D117054
MVMALPGQQSKLKKGSPRDIRRAVRLWVDDRHENCQERVIKRQLTISYSETMSRMSVWDSAGCMLEIDFGHKKMNSSGGEFDNAQEKHLNPDNTAFVMRTMFSGFFVMELTLFVIA